MKKNIKKHLINNEERCRYCEYSQRKSNCCKENAPYYGTYKTYENVVEKGSGHSHREIMQNDSYYPCCDNSNHSHHENRRERKMHNPLKVCSILMWASILIVFAILSIWNSVAKVNANSYDIPETIFLSEKALTVDEFGNPIIIVDDVYSENE